MASDLLALTIPQTNDVIRIVILDEERLVGDALERFLEIQPDMDVVANVGFRQAAAVASADMHPDVAIVNFGGDVAAATDATEDLRRAGCEAPMIVLADSGASYDVALAAIEVEASALVSGAEPAAGLVTAVRMAAAGRSLLQPGIVSLTLSARRVREHSLRHLTRREMDVLRLLSVGRGSREIAAALGINYVTVRTHLRNLAGKLAAHSKLETLARAYQLRLVRAPRLPVDAGVHQVPAELRLSVHN